ncbi:cytochrome b/b6 domain-containing protein [Paraglaciecola aquimarina]|uniref:Cytochrome b/b6 domain-containing protein n=1 Tax=Paraglaciecola aquimarina TaxID=1235557 RepID=A0ABU3SUN0_9ALTE|nr:cytochrome b/b6 domain-containing protein [Paraglaciecola aquimarina]MDU0353725.1 cytochrome b/b6 domain-containing protein [Paraglaciecola aquimarina]
MSSVKVWDSAIRLFHWAIVICVFGAWLTMENRWILAHEIFGYSLLSLIIFRLMWGLVGSTTAKFSHFITSPNKAIRYLQASLKLSAEHHSGHNPAGAWMVVVLLGLLLLQTLSGLYSNNDLGFTGPLADGISKQLSDWFTQLHAWNFNLILAAIWLHLVAVFFYVLVKKENLVKAMFTGEKPKEQAGKYQNLKFVSSIKALLLLFVAALAVMILVI